MIRWLLCSILLLLGSIAPALTLEEANAQLGEAQLLFGRGEAQKAQEIYVRLAEEGFASAQLWTNAGTAAYRAGDEGRAVLYYSRALRLDPSYDRALQSLRFVQPDSNVADSGTEFLRSTVGFIAPTWWALGAQAIFLVVCFSFARSIARWRHAEERSHWLIVGVWSVVFLAAVAGLTAWSHAWRVGGNDAVVLTKGAIARSEPRPESTAQLELPAGTIVTMLEAPGGGFVRIKLADGQSGFLSTRDLEPI